MTSHTVATTSTAANQGIPHTPLSLARMWMTTGDVAKLLDLTLNGVRFLEREQELTCERTESGRRLFRRADVRRLLILRTERQARSRAAVLLALRPRMVNGGLEPRQLSLFRPMRPRLHLVDPGERSLHQGEVKAADSFDVRQGSEKGSYVDRKVAGSTG